MTNAQRKSRQTSLMNDPVAEPSGHEDPESSSSGTAPQWTSEQILKGHHEALIIHDGKTYRLRWTRNNKLILHK